MSDLESPKLRILRPRSKSPKKKALLLDETSAKEECIEMKTGAITNQTSEKDLAEEVLVLHTFSS